MDQKMESERKNEPSKFCDTIPDNQLNDVANKFRAYRLDAEATSVRLKGADRMINQLKTDMNISKRVESNLRSQVTSAENRLIRLQKTNSKILTFLERFRQNEGASLGIEQKINQLQDELHKIKEKSEILNNYISNEMNLMKRCEELTLNLKNKESEVHLIKTENKILAQQKRELEIQAEQKYKILENNVEELKREAMEMRAQYEQNLQHYKKQIQDQELTLKEYERERKCLLEEFAMPESLACTSGVTRADSANSSLSDDRSSKNSEPVKKPLNSEYDEEEEPFLTSASSRGSQSFHKKPKLVSFRTKKGYKQIPQLEFLTSNATKKTLSDAPPPKRRLFSQNFNHYMN